MPPDTQKGTVPYKGRYATYQISPERAAHYAAWLKTTKGKAWVARCNFVDREYQTMMRSHVVRREQR